MDGWVQLDCCAPLWTLFCTKLGRVWKDRKRENGCSPLLLLVVQLNFPQHRCFSWNLIWVKNGNPAVPLTEPNQNMVFFQHKNMRRPSSSAHQWLLSGGWAPHRVLIIMFLRACMCMGACFVVLVCVAGIGGGGGVICSDAPLLLYANWTNAGRMKHWGCSYWDEKEWKLFASCSLSPSFSLPLSPLLFALCHQAGWVELGIKPPLPLTHTPPPHIYYANRSG